MVTESYIPVNGAWSTHIDWTKHDPAWSYPTYTAKEPLWQPAVQGVPTPAVLRPLALGMPTSVVQGEVKPTSVEQTADGSWVYAFPKNFLGTVKVEPLPSVENGSKLEILAGE